MGRGSGGGESLQTFQGVRQREAEVDHGIGTILPGGTEGGGGESGSVELGEEARESTPQPYGAGTASVPRRAPQIEFRDTTHTARRKGGRKGGGKGKRGGKQNTVDVVAAELRRMGIEMGSAQWSLYYNSEHFRNHVVGRGGLSIVEWHLAVAAVGAWAGFGCLVVPYFRLSGLGGGTATYLGGCWGRLVQRLP